MTEVIKVIFASSDRKFIAMLSVIVFCCKAKKPSTEEVLDFIKTIQNNKK